MYSLGLDAPQLRDNRRMSLSVTPLAQGSTPLPPPRLQLTGITKRYPAVVANNAISLQVQPGEIHAVLGENGAGSTASGSRSA